MNVSDKSGYLMPDKLFAKHGIRMLAGDRVKFDLYDKNYDGDHGCVYTLSHFVKNNREFTHFDDAIGKWLSAALEDEVICKEFKEDIKKWFDQFNIKYKIRCTCINMCGYGPESWGKHHHVKCLEYNTDKNPYLFYYEDGVDAWLPSDKKISNTKQDVWPFLYIEGSKLKYKIVYATDKEIADLEEA